MLGFLSDKQAVIGTLKATGSRDTDVLYSTKEALKATSKPPLIISWIVTLVGVLMCLTIIGALVGIPFILGSWWLRSYIKKYTTLIDSSYEEYLQEILKTNTDSSNENT